MGDSSLESQVELTEGFVQIRFQIHFVSSST